MVNEYVMMNSETSDALWIGGHDSALDEEESGNGDEDTEISGTIGSSAQ